MSRFYMMATVAVSAMFLFVSCAGGGSGPVAPDLQTTVNNHPAVTDNVHLWGLWEVTLDPADGTAEVVPIRGAAFTANVTQFMQPPTASQQLMSIYIDPSSDFTTGYVVVDVTFTHPFPGLDMFTGFDVRGACIGDGAEQGIIDPQIRYGGEDDLRVLNADGLTRWFNSQEFSTYETMFGYTRGKLGTPSDNWLATLNGYRYFCDDLGKEEDLFEFFTDPLCVNPRGFFSAGENLTRRYELQFSLDSGVPDYRFQYAVVANWEAPDVDPPVNIPDDFPLNANCHEAFAFFASDQSDMFYIEGEGEGGSLNLTLRVLDHQGAADLSQYADEISAIHLETPDGLIDGGMASFEGADLASAIVDITESGIEYFLTVDAVTPYANGDFPVLVVIESSDPNDYDSGLPGFAYPVNAALAAYSMASVYVDDEAPYEDPVAVASVVAPESPYYKGDHLEFDGSDSYDPDNDPPQTEGIVNFEWDWDNNGSYEEESTSPVAWHTWDTVGTYNVQLRVTDDEGATDTLDEPLEIEVLSIPQPQLVEKLTGFHSPTFSQVDTQNNDGWVDCTQASPVQDFGFYRIDNDENVEKIFEKEGYGFFGMPGPFVLSVEERKILAPNMLSFGDLLVDFWDIDDESTQQFFLPVDPNAGIFFCGDVELFSNLSVAVLSDPIANRLVTWDYSETTPTYTDYYTPDYPNILEGDYEDDRLFVYSRNSGNSVVEVWDASDWTVIDTMDTINPGYPFMSDMNFDPYWQQLYFPGGTGGDLEVWETETYSHVTTLNTGPAAVTGVDHMGGGIYITGYGYLVVFDADTLSVLWTVPVPGADLRVISCNPNTHKLYIPDMDESVYVFQL